MPAYPQSLRDLIVERVAAGESVRRICAEPGMPCKDSVGGWARCNPDFAARLAAAQLKGRHRRYWAFDEARARALLARLAAGEPIKSILDDPAMPSPKVYRYWRADQGWFAAEVFRLNGIKREARAARCRAGLRVFDQAVADRIVARVARDGGLRRVLAADPALPKLDVVRRWRAEQPEFDAVLRTAIKVGRRVLRATRWRTPELTEEICCRIRMGESLNTIGRDPEMPCAATLYGWVRRDAAFASQVIAACHDREDWYADLMVEAVEGGGDAAAIKARLKPIRAARRVLQKRPGRCWGDGLERP